MIIINIKLYLKIKDVIFNTVIVHFRLCHFSSLSYLLDTVKKRKYIIETASIKQIKIE